MNCVWLQQYSEPSQDERSEEVNEKWIQFRYPMRNVYFLGNSWKLKGKIFLIFYYSYAIFRRWLCYDSSCHITAWWISFQHIALFNIDKYLGQSVESPIKKKTKATFNEASQQQWEKSRKRRKCAHCTFWLFVKIVGLEVPATRCDSM